MGKLAGRSVGEMRARYPQGCIQILALSDSYLRCQSLGRIRDGRGPFQSPDVGIGVVRSIQEIRATVDPGKDGSLLFLAEALEANPQQPRVLGPGQVEIDRSRIREIATSGATVWNRCRRKSARRRKKTRRRFSNDTTRSDRQAGFDSTRWNRRVVDRGHRDEHGGRRCDSPHVRQSFFSSSTNSLPTRRCRSGESWQGSDPATRKVRQGRGLPIFGWSAAAFPSFNLRSQ